MFLQGAEVDGFFEYTTAALWWVRDSRSHAAFRVLVQALVASWNVHALVYSRQVRQPTSIRSLLKTQHVGSRTLMSTRQVEANEFCFFESIQAVDARVSANFRRKAVVVGVAAHG